MVDDSMQARHGDIIDEFIRHLIGDDVGLELAILLFTLDGLDFFINIDAEEGPQQHHRQDDANDAKRIGGSIA